MNKKEELRSEIWNIWQILIFARECFHYSLYLTKPETKEEQEYLRGNQDFGFIRHVLWRMCAIELSKLFSEKKDRDRFNIHHFIKKLKSGGHFSDFEIADTTIAQWEVQIKSNESVIKKILTLRDKVYAHTDANKENHTNGDLSFDHTEKLIHIIESVIKEIYYKVFESDAIMETIVFDKRRFNIIKVLASERQRNIDEQLSPIRKRK